MSRKEITCLSSERFDLSIASHGDVPPELTAPRRAPAGSCNATNKTKQNKTYNEPEVEQDYNFPRCLVTRDHEARSTRHTSMPASLPPPHPPLPIPPQSARTDSDQRQVWREHPQSAIRNCGRSLHYAPPFARVRGGGAPAVAPFSPSVPPQITHTRRATRHAPSRNATSFARACALAVCGPHAVNTADF